MKNQPDLESSIREQLNQIKSVPARNPQVAARARARFLAEAVAASEARRNKGWGFVFRRQQFALNMVMALVVIVGLLAGGGTTVRAAQDDLPNEPLYPIKTLSEDISLQLENDPEAKVDRLMELTETRVQEMSQMVEAGQTPPERVRLRLEQHLQQTLQLCSDMADAKLDQKLLQVRTQLRQHEQAVQNLQSRAPQTEQPVLEHTRTMLQTQLQLVDNGLANHEAFRETVRNGFQSEQTQTPPIVEPTATTKANHEQNGQATSEPGNQGNGNENEVNPTIEPAETDPDIISTPTDTGSDKGNDADKENKGSKSGENGSGNSNKDKDKNKKK